MKTKNYCITLLALLCFSCNNSTQKSKKGIDKILAEDSVVKKYSNGVISLANSTNIPEILCQEWVQEDDAQTLKDVDETSMLSLSIRTFHFFNDGSFIKITVMPGIMAIGIITMPLKQLP
ncbi:MAG: hypothetical protein IPP48_15200 [Chitinophagaceae bacterium]|nr:hypothetical protein [Chitinophagaceae bacterium]